MPIPRSPIAAFLAGRTQFALLTFVEEVEPRPLQRSDGRRFVRRGMFSCRCGGTIVADLRNVRRGFTRSCGCCAGKPIPGLPTVKTGRIIGKPT